MAPPRNNRDETPPPVIVQQTDPDGNPYPIGFEDQPKAPSESVGDRASRVVGNILDSVATTVERAANQLENQTPEERERRDEDLKRAEELRRIQRAGGNPEESASLVNPAAYPTFAYGEDHRPNTVANGAPVNNGVEIT